MACIQVFIINYGIISQALVVFLMVTLFLILNLKKKPFIQDALNNLETASLIASSITIYFGLYFISDLPAIYNSTNPIIKEADNGCKFKFS